MASGHTLGTHSTLGWLGASPCAPPQYPPWGPCEKINSGEAGQGWARGLKGKGSVRRRVGAGAGLGGRGRGWLAPSAPLGAGPCPPPLRTWSRGLDPHPPPASHSRRACAPRSPISAACKRRRGLPPRWRSLTSPWNWPMSGPSSPLTGGSTAFTMVRAPTPLPTPYGQALRRSPLGAHNPHRSASHAGVLRCIAGKKRLPNQSKTGRGVPTEILKIGFNVFKIACH